MCMMPYKHASYKIGVSMSSCFCETDGISLRETQRIFQGDF